MTVQPARRHGEKQGEPDQEMEAEGSADTPAAGTAGRMGWRPHVADTAPSSGNMHSPSPVRYSLSPGTASGIVSSACRSGRSMRGLPVKASKRSRTKASGRSLGDQHHAGAPVERIGPCGHALRRMEHSLHAMQDQRPVGIVGHRDDRLHPQQLFAMGGAQEIDEHFERHRLDRPVVDKTERPDIRPMPVLIMMMMVVVMTTIVVAAMLMIISMVMIVVMIMVVFVMIRHRIVLQPAADIGDLGGGIVEPTMERVQPCPPPADRHRSSVRAD